MVYNPADHLSYERKKELIGLSTEDLNRSMESICELSSTILFDHKNELTHINNFCEFVVSERLKGVTHDVAPSGHILSYKDGFQI